LKREKARSTKNEKKKETKKGREEGKQEINNNRQH
jgi:hypothetical protein